MYAFLSPAMGGTACQAKSTVCLWQDGDHCTPARGTEAPNVVRGDDQPSAVCSAHCLRRVAGLLAGEAMAVWLAGWTGCLAGWLAAWRRSSYTLYPLYYRRVEISSS